MANISTIRPENLVRVPQNYPTTPTPGKLRLLYDENKRALYHKLSPYGYETFLGIKTRQPFQYVYPDEGKDANNLFIVDLFGRTVTDVERVAKFMGSQNGILFLTNQFLMQTGNAFNETRIWNPSSPVVAAGMPLTLWAARPQRNIDTGNILGSLLGGVGQFIGGLFGTGPKVPATPPGAIGAALPTNNQAGAKGLLRAGTANKAKTELMTKWQVQKSGGGLGQFFGDTLKGIFGNFLPQRQSGVSRRSDEIAYGLMLGSTTGEFGVFSYQGLPDSKGNQGTIDGVQQFWFGGSTSLMRRGNKGPIDRPLNWVKIYVDERGRPMWEPPRESYRIDGLTGTVGYQVTDTTKAVKYGDHVGVSKNLDWEASDVLIQQSYYVETGRKYPSKLTDKTSPSFREIQDSLNRFVTGIQKSNVYNVDTIPESSVVRASQKVIGYDRIVAMKKHGAVESQYKHSVLEEYRQSNVRVLENQHSNTPALTSKKMASSGQFDGLNTLKVLDKTKAIDNGLIPGWTEWKPYQDDQIAFYFYDLVNEKYIPFRATIRGLQETDSANWEELTFIGRADRLYSYSGFNRSLTFAFTIHISSIVELAPTWQRINYLMSLVKPAKYTVKGKPDALNSLYSRFMVPPMITVTIGDLYKNQPIVLASLGISIPDTALWETLNSENSSQWSYLLDYIKAPGVGKLYGQLPTTAEISVNAYILEQERAVVGASHFGKAPHTEQYQEGQYRDTPLDKANSYSDLHKSMVVFNK